ncbi:MAG: 3'-5' exonuclease, partial [Epsilonproteobacteria bacterium]|nr:3'-5' exonuclease [Campylobacterota bacterium]
MLMFIDLETTGLELNDVVCAIGLLYEKNNALHVKYDLVNEGKKIPPLASSINNITNEMIKDKVPLKKTQCYQILQENIQSSILVAHNIPFELLFLEKYGFEQNINFIDTLRVTRHLIDDLESYNLNFLRYEMKLYHKERILLEQLGIKEQKLC